MMMPIAVVPQSRVDQNIERSYGGCSLKSCRNVLGAIAITVAFWLSGCTPQEDYESQIENSLGVTAVVPQDTQERQWLDISLTELFTVPMRDEVELFVPRAVRADETGNFFVMDFGDFKAKGFDRDGKYLNSYGAGIGEAPGELTQGVIDLGVLDDSLVYVTDRITQRASVFAIEGPFVTSYELSRKMGLRPPGLPFRHTITPMGHRYTMFSSGGSLFEVGLNDGKKHVSFGPPNDGSGSRFDKVYGMMTSYNERLVYVPTNYPAILQYNPDGSLKYARATLDYGHTELPYSVSETINGVPIERPGARIVNGTVSTSGGKIYVQAFLESGNAIDVYEADNGGYEYSFRSVEGYDVFGIGDRVYQALDSTVVVWAIEHGGE